MEIHSLEELFIYASKVANNEVEFEQPILLGKNEDYAISLHIDGKNWDKRIDVRIAKYIINLQNSINTLIKDFSFQNENYSFDIKVEAKEGSNIPYTEIKDLIIYLINKLPPTMTFISIITSIAAISGCFIFSRYNRRKEREAELNADTSQHKQNTEVAMKALDTATQLSKQHSEIALKALDVLQTMADNSPEKYAGYEKPVRSLINSLDDNDEIGISDYPMMSAIEAKKSGPKRMPRSEEKTSYADGEYLILNQNDSQGEPIFTISSDDIDVTGYISALDEIDQRNFIKEIDHKRVTTPLPISINLQVNIIHTKRKIKYASIIGIGNPRPDKNHKKLSEILN